MLVVPPTGTHTNSSTRSKAPEAPVALPSAGIAGQEILHEHPGSPSDSADGSCARSSFAVYRRFNRGGTRLEPILDRRPAASSASVSTASKEAIVSSLIHLRKLSRIAAAALAALAVAAPVASARPIIDPPTTSPTVRRRRRGRRRRARPHRRRWLHGGPPRPHPRGALIAISRPAPAGRGPRGRTYLFGLQAANDAASDQARGCFGCSTDPAADDTSTRSHANRRSPAACCGGQPARPALLARCRRFRGPRAGTAGGPIACFALGLPGGHEHAVRVVPGGVRRRAAGPRLVDPADRRSPASNRTPPSG